MLSYLSNRIKLEYGCISNVTKEIWEIKSVVPQKSVLGPLLFNISINDIFYMNLDYNICNFKDDTTRYLSRQSIDKVIVYQQT